MESKTARFFIPFFIFGVLGAISVLLDLDHVWVLFWEKVPITIENLGTRAGRPFHWPSVMVSGGLCLISWAYHIRLLSKMDSF